VRRDVERPTQRVNLAVLVPFSCRGRSFCPSCEKTKQLVWAEWLREDVLAPVAHRHVVLTIPRLLRPLFRRRRELLTALARGGADAVQELARLATGRAEPQDKQRLEDTAAYLVRNPLSLKKLVYLDGQQAVLYSPG